MQNNLQQSLTNNDSHVGPVCNLDIMFCTANCFALLAPKFNTDRLETALTDF